MPKKSIDTGLTINQLKFFFVGVLVFFKLAPENNIKHWSWFWVTTPLWIFDVALLVFLALLFIGTFIIRAINQAIAPREDDDDEN